MRTRRQSLHRLQLTFHGGSGVVLEHKGVGTLQQQSCRNNTSCSGLSVGTQRCSNITTKSGIGTQRYRNTYKSTAVLEHKGVGT